MNYKNEWYLEPEERINEEMLGQMDLDSGVTLLIADVGTGKSYSLAKRTNNLFGAPLLSIVGSVEGIRVLTWNAIVSMVQSTIDKSVFKDMTITIDEAHGIYTDFSYKSKVIRELIDSFKYFKSVIIMSGTTKSEYFNSFNIDRVYRVHKQQEAMKEIKTYYYDRNGKAVLESMILANKGKRRSIALVNDIKLCKRIAKKYGDKALVVSSEVKEEENVKSFFESKLMTNSDHDYELIIGTDSIREGLSIEDKEERVDIFIYGDTDPDGIEQFCNRFRNVSVLKTVHYIVPVRDSRTLPDFDIATYTADAQMFAESVTERYRSFTNDVFRDNFKAQYSQDVKGSHLRYDRESDGFIVDMLSIDAAYADHRFHQTVYDRGMFEYRMMDYDFNVQPPVLLSGDNDVAESIRADMAIIKREQAEERDEVLSSLVDSYRSGTFTYAGKHEEYDAIRESIDKLLKAGLKPEQIEQVVHGVIGDKSFISRVWSDYSYVDEHSNIRNKVLMYIAKECPDDSLSFIDMTIISNLIIGHVLKELFDGDKARMKKNKLWSQVIQYERGDLVVKAGQEAKIINRYITLDKRVQKRVGSSTPDFLKAVCQMRKIDRYSTYPVKYTTLSGIEIDKEAVEKEAERKFVGDVAALRTRFMALHAA